MVPSEEDSELCTADLAHGHTLIGYHDWSFVTKLLHLGTLHHLCMCVGGGSECVSVECVCMHEGQEQVTAEIQQTNHSQQRQVE